MAIDAFECNAPLIADLEKPVFMFSGQGSQRVGMGSDLLEIPLVADTFSCASDAFGQDIGKLVAEGPRDVLDDTRNAQAAILALSLSLVRLLQEEKREACAVLGFSLGQISALYAAGMLSFEAVLALGARRAGLMAEAAEENPGAMCALLGADEEAAQSLCDRNARGEVLVIANYNCPGQIVVSGSVSAIERAEIAWSEDGKKSARLATSGAFHSPLMASAAKEFSLYLEGVEFSQPKIPLIGNTDARPLDATNVAALLADHLTCPVMFQQSIESLDESGADTYVEIGYGGVLIGLVRRIAKESKRLKIEDRASLEAFLATQTGGMPNVGQ